MTPRATGTAAGSLHDALLVLWTALIGADRIDLLGGGGPFQLTPFLSLTPIVFASELLRRRTLGHPIRLPPRSPGFLAVALALVAVCGLSVFVSPEITKSGSRLALLAVDVLGIAFLLLATWDRDALDPVLERGAVAGLLLFAAFDMMQLATLAGVFPDRWHLGSVSVDLYPYTYGGIVPRLSGTVADQNRSGLVLLFYGWFVGYRPGRGPRTSLLLLAFALSVLTLSRSAAVAGLATIVVLLLERKLSAPSARALLLSSLVVAAATFWLLASPPTRTWVGTALQPLAQRASVDEGSSQEHLLLISRGVKEATASLPRLALGLGYGSAYTVLQDVFPGNRYGNFHSLYVTMFAESGVVALLCVIVLFVVPIAGKSRYRALLAGAAVFNLFYQAQTEPVFWVIMTLAWYTIPPRRLDRPPGTGATAGAGGR